MSTNLLWKRDASGAEHPAQELLLAFIRQQCAEDEQHRVDQHLRVGCALCAQLYTELNQSSHTLDSLQHTSRYLYYPELQTNQVLQHIQGGEPLTSAVTGKRKRKYQVRNQVQVKRQYAPKRSMRIVSLPAAFALFLLFMTVVFAVAYALVSSGLRLPLPWQPSGGYHNDSGSNTANLAPHTTPTLTSTNIIPGTVTPGPSQSATPTVTVISSPTPSPTAVDGPTIETCPKQNNWNVFFSICGSGFKPGDKVSLVVRYSGSNRTVVFGPYKVKKSGDFIGPYVYLCMNAPVAIYARDTASVPPIVSNTLSGDAIVTCKGPTPATPPPG